MTPGLGTRECVRRGTALPSGSPGRLLRALRSGPARRRTIRSVFRSGSWRLCSPIFPAKRLRLVVASTVRVRKHWRICSAATQNQDESRSICCRPSNRRGLRGSQQARSYSVWFQTPECSGEVTEMLGTPTNACSLIKTLHADQTRERALQGALTRLYKAWARSPIPPGKTRPYYANYIYQMFTPGCMRYRGGVETVRHVIHKPWTSGLYRLKDYPEANGGLVGGQRRMGRSVRRRG